MVEFEVPTLLKCNDHDDVSALLVAMKRQCTDDKEACTRLPVIGYLSCFQKLWSGKILSDNKCNPSLVVILIQKFGPIEEWQEVTVPTRLLVWTKGDYVGIQAIKQQCTELMQKGTTFYVMFTSADTWHSIQRLYPTLPLHLRPPMSSVFVAVLKHDVNFVEQECPEEYYFKELSMTDAIAVASNWKFSDSTTTLWFRGFAKAGLGIGAFTKTDDTMVCWAFAMDSGAIGSLVTIEGHRRKNLASKVVQMLCKKLTALGLRPFVVIEDIETSHVPEKFFSKLGFAILKDHGRLLLGVVEI